MDKPTSPVLEESVGGMPPERLAEIEARTDAATEGPWWFDESEDCWRLYGVAFRVAPQAGGLIPEQIVNKQILKAAKRNTPYAEYWPTAADAVLIVNAWADLRALVAEVKRLQAKDRNGLVWEGHLAGELVFIRVLAVGRHPGDRRYSRQQVRFLVEEGWHCPATVTHGLPMPGGERS